jgi:hypothetical protein
MAIFMREETLRHATQWKLERSKFRRPNRCFAQSGFHQQLQALPRDRHAQLTGGRELSSEPIIQMLKGFSIGFAVSHMTIATVSGLLRP